MYCTDLHVSVNMMAVIAHGTFTNLCH